MHTSRFVYFLLIAVASHAYAGAGQTSSGVTTTVPTSDPTAATQAVQEQSSNFAQQNQALAGTNGVNSTTGTVTGVGTAGTAKPGQAGATDANGKPVDPNNPSASTDPKAANAPPAAPAVPPPPPPEYVSNVKKVDRSAVIAEAAPVAAASADKKAGDATKSAPPADVDPSAITAPGMQRQSAAQKPLPRPAPEPADRTGAEHVAVGTGSSGGSGEAPDSYAFYIGLIVAGALLAFAAAMFLRVEKGGAR